jgi:hypothetical protein
MSLTVHVPDELAGRLSAEAARRGMGVEQLSAELLAAGLPITPGIDPVEAFIGSGDSGDPSWAGGETRQLRLEAVARRSVG